MTALKMCEYLHDWRVRKSINTRFLRNVIQQVVLYSFTSMRRQAQKKGLTLGDTGGGIRKEAVIWLGYQAFHYVLGKRQSKYRDIVQWLSVENAKSNRRNHCYMRKFQTLMKSGQARIAEVLTD
ncbi:hypothetical protein BJ165DRAFT_1017031 [Panaeolus papilionaceus]|nr:hypothetical protein BJ165DRAFT_1017031 [Panaeolus papilionaceus]